MQLMQIRHEGRGDGFAFGINLVIDVLEMFERSDITSRMKEDYTTKGCCRKRDLKRQYCNGGFPKVLLRRWLFRAMTRK